MSVVLWILAAVVLVVPLAVLLYLRSQMEWLRRKTEGDRWYGLRLAERRAVAAEIRRRARAVVPIARGIGRVYRRRVPVVVYRDVTVPEIGCPKERMVAAVAYEPDARDVFVVTQMKCGTTWAQQIVYETLMRGRGDLGDEGHRHMYALSPWIESNASVSMDDAPRLTERELRIIKTHLPVSVCPWSDDALYVYVMRNPVACFASCVDFIRMVVGPIAFTLPEFVEWFCSDRMWWRSWPEHVSGWWSQAQDHPNVLFLHYEAMLEDLPSAVDRVASLLDVRLSSEERAAVVEKSGYDYMKSHEDWFQMTPPTFFSETSELGYFVGGSNRARDADVGPEERARVVAFVKERLAGHPFPLGDYYPGL